MSEPKEAKTPKRSKKLSKSIDPSSLSSTGVDSSSTTPTKTSKSAQIKQLKEELSKAQQTIEKLQKKNNALKKKNEELQEELETLRSVLSVHRQQKLEETIKEAKKEKKLDEDEDEFDDDAIETFNKQAASDDTTIKKYASGHVRTKSTPGGNDPLAPPPSRKSVDVVPSTITKNQQSSDTVTRANTAIGTKSRPTRPTGAPARKTKFNTASNLSRTVISREDALELGGSVDDNTRKVVDSLNLVSGRLSADISSKRRSAAASAASAAATPSNDSQKVESDHPRIFDENTVLDILCGLGITSSRNFDDEDGSILTPKDYSYSYQFKVRRTSDQLLKFKDFAPKVFHQVRKFFKVSEAELLFSFRYDNLDAVRGAGKSGAFFIFTKDRRFILKTATKEERDFLWELMPYYLQYIRKNPNTLLPRFYGVYSMKHEGIGGVVRFVIMNNWFNSVLEPVEKYDLKGSTVGRTVGDDKNGILKDLDIKRKFYFSPDLRKQITEQLKRDSEFLAQHNVMDYSLLVGVYYDTGSKAQRDAIQRRRERDREDTSFKSAFQMHEGGTLGYNGEQMRHEVYFCGIIDVLQRYNVAKKFEHFIKSIPYKADEISIVAPSYYAKRFYDFVSDKFADEASVNNGESKDSKDTKDLKESKRGAESKKSSDDSRNRSHTVT